MSRPTSVSPPGDTVGRLAHLTNAQLWIEVCDQLGLPYDLQQLGRWDRCRVWDEIDRIRSGGGDAA